ncbi:MAG: DNA methyltransferase, partial [Spirochaetes bacterium]|nr:DNA methyltransferase [Spirochaetota bacterium]
MAKARKTNSDKQQVIHYQHADDKRKNIPTAVIAGQGSVPKAEKKRYYYNPHLAPVLRFDSTGKADQISALLEKARNEPINAEEHQLLAEALRNHQPWLEWTGKREAEEKGWFEVDPVALNIHERISTQAILRSARREDVQRELFADPHEPWQEAVKFYQHDIDWTNRLILGDSLQVMSSLAHRENLAGKVQMIYIDPPYGIKYASNFQANLFIKDTKDSPNDLTREPEMVRAYRDTWQLGVHSYLEYLRDRLVAARQLLNQSGSIFIQISDVNLHNVRVLLDETFGSQNYIGVISFSKTSGQTSRFLSATSDYLLWYGNDSKCTKYRKLFGTKELGGQAASMYQFLEQSSGHRRRLTIGENTTDESVFRLGDITSQRQGRPSGPGS